MKLEKIYPYNLIEDLLFGKEFYSELNDEEILREVKNLLLDLSEIYVINKYIPKKMQTIIYLYYVENISYKEIGNILGISSSRVGQIKQRTLRILRHPSRLNRLLLRNP